jgi:dTDP-4-dehydrorhamnose 3,5-epimerase
MQFRQLEIDGVWLIVPEPHADERGFFARTFCTREFGEQGLWTSFVQQSVSFNEVAGTLRGMHYQLEPYGEVKLVRCTQGAIYDVVVDLRAGSPTHGKWCAEVLSADDRRALYVPRGCAHGFITTVDRSEVSYAISEFHHAAAARGVRWDDPAFGIAWPLAPQRISARDAAYPLLAERTVG